MILRRPARYLTLQAMNLSTNVGRNGREESAKGVLHRNPRNPNLNISLALWI